LPLIPTCTPQLHHHTIKQTTWNMKAIQI